MTPTHTLWYQLGNAYERARIAAAERAEADGDVPARTEDDGKEGRERRPRRREESMPSLPWPDPDELLSAAAWMVLDGVVGRSGRSRRPGIVRLAWAGVAGAAAALLLDLLRPLLLGDAKAPFLDEGTVDRLISGAGQGLVYGALVDPRVPGPALLKGALFGSVEYATDELGGLSEVFAKHTPQGRVPVVRDLFAGRDPHERAFLEHLVFGIALALLYESSPSSNGILSEDDEG